ncbi:MAG: hypothetical protein ACRBN8_10645 [Nannocystales bacterium]
MMMKRKQISAVLAFVACVVSLSGCEAMFGDQVGDDCYVNADYEIRCERDGPGLQTP